MSTVAQKEIAISFLELVTIGKIDEAYEKYIDPTFYHHNAFYKGDLDSLKQGMTENQSRFPNKSLSIQKVLEEGNVVMTYSRVRLSSDMPDMAVVHMFRFEQDRIIELWDVGQQIPANSPNENGSF